jgi:hypothetical protein
MGRAKYLEEILNKIAVINRRSWGNDNASADKTFLLDNWVVVPAGL